MYTRIVATTWDPDKAKQNLKKHGIRFAEAVIVLDDPYSVTVTDHDSDPEEEERCMTLGADAYGQLLVVVYTYRHDDIRLISARRATPREREAYGRQR